MRGIKVKCLLMALCAAAFVGCGDGEAVHTNAEVSETEAAQSEDAGAADEEAEISQTGESDEAEVRETQEDEASDTEEGAELVTDGISIAPVEMDETRRSQLVVVLRRGGGGDGSVVEWGC